MFHDINNQEANEAWQAATNNPDLWKSGDGPNKRVAVHGIPRIEGVRSKAFQRELGHESDLGSSALMETALGRLDFGTQGVDISRDFGGVMGEAFRPGAAVGSGSAMVADVNPPGMPTVTPEQVSAMSLRASGPSPSTPAMTPARALGDGPDCPPTAMSPGSSRIAVLY